MVKNPLFSHNSAGQLSSSSSSFRVLLFPCPCASIRSLPPHTLPSRLDRKPSHHEYSDASLHRPRHPRRFGLVRSHHRGGGRRSIHRSERRPPSKEIRDWARRRRRGSYDETTVVRSRSRRRSRAAVVVPPLARRGPGCIRS